ncbi:DNA-binding protein [Longibacter salinarum]|nr:DNA-binding protein [Longibacter salinarum]
MKKLTLQLSDDTAQRLEVLAEKLGVSPEEIVQAGLAEQLSSLDREYEQAAARVLQKNEELYRRLS